MKIYEIIFSRNSGLKSKWITNHCKDESEAYEWFKQMLLENYHLTPSRFARTCRSASFKDVTATISTTAQTLYIPKSKMFQF